ncbi:MAG: hypothetical protein MUC77_09775 [Chromatiaceae bacterium]|nr:hypothetical protein [Chromatiaceae bacterium]
MSLRARVSVPAALLALLTLTAVPPSALAWSSSGYSPAYSYGGYGRHGYGYRGPSRYYSGGYGYTDRKYLGHGRYGYRSGYAGRHSRGHSGRTRVVVVGKHRR